MKEQAFRIPHAESMRRMMVVAYRLVEQMTKDGPVEVVVRKAKKLRTDPQLRTLWMWHSQVASELAIRTKARWTRDNVHEMVFKPRWMPLIELPMPDGTVMRRSMGTSEKSGPDGDDRDVREIISEAMTAYLAWVYEMGIEVTVPDPIDWQVGHLESAA